MKTPDLKPCQAAARGTVRWNGSLLAHDCVCQVDCIKYEHHASMLVSKECMGCYAQQIVERNVMRELCKGCKEAENDEGND